MSGKLGVIECWVKLGIFDNLEMLFGFCVCVEV